MKLIFIGLFDTSRDLIEEITQSIDIETFPYFKRLDITKYTNSIAKIAVKSTNYGTNQTLKLGDDVPFTVHTSCLNNGICACLIGDTEYPSNVSFSLLNRILLNYDKVDQNFLQDLLKTYQNPTNFDKILKLQQEIANIKEIMQRNISEILKRGETLDTLIDKVDKLDETSKIFYHKTKTVTGCCKYY
jgi:synaptobrevin family protein YKT6